MKIIILGGTGFLGRKIIANLINDGHEVMLLYNPSHHYSDEVFSNPLVKMIDLQKLNELNENDIDIAYSVIGVYSRKGVPDIDVINGNLIVPLTFFNWCLTHNIMKFISIDTGLPDNFNIYSKTKASFREIGRWYAEKIEGFQFVNCSLELFYGEDEPLNRFIPNTVLRLKNNETINMTTGLQKRDYIYAPDAAKILCQLSSISFPNYINIQIGTGVAPSVREVVTYLKEVTGSKSVINFGAVPLRANEPDSVADLTIMNKYGLSAKTSWQEGMKILADKIKTN